MSKESEDVPMDDGMDTSSENDDEDHDDDDLSIDSDDDDDDESIYAAAESLIQQVQELRHEQEQLAQQNAQLMNTMEGIIQAFQQEPPPSDPPQQQHRSFINLLSHNIFLMLWIQYSTSR